MKRLLILLLAQLALTFTVCASTKLKVLQLNIWQEGTKVENGFDAIIDEIIHTDADIVLLSEVRNYNNCPLIPRVTEALKQKGALYYGNAPTKLDVGIISKFPQADQTEIYPDGNGSGSILRVTMQVGKQCVAVYSAHLNYTNYACYLPRGYDGMTWEKLPARATDADSVLIANRRSWRDESITVFLEKVRQDIDRKHRVILGGDFNEPSHLDWQDDSKDLWDHNGLIINWDCSTLLYNDGFRDAYRMVYPNVLTHPGFTFPSDNPDLPVKNLTWAPDADERDRIDFIYYYPMPGFKPKKAWVVGPRNSIVRNERKAETSKDKFIQPKGTWPSDHKGVLVEFSL